MKLGRHVLLEIMALFHEALEKNESYSDKLRGLDLVPADDEEIIDGQAIVVLGLSPDYLQKHPRAGEWKDETGES